MDDATYEAQKARIQRLIDLWVKPLGLGWWTLHFEYERVPDDSGIDDTVTRRLARCWANWPYAEATIRFFMPCVADQTDDELEQAFLHEMGHVFLNEMRELRHDAANWCQHEERTATVLAKAFLWVRDAFARECDHAQEREQGDAAAAGAGALREGAPADSHAVHARG